MPKLSQELKKITMFLEKPVFSLLVQWLSVWYIIGTQYMFVELDPVSGSMTGYIFNVSGKEILYLLINTLRSPKFKRDRARKWEHMLVKWGKGLENLFAGVPQSSCKSTCILDVSYLDMSVNVCFFLFPSRGVSSSYHWRLNKTDCNKFSKRKGWGYIFHLFLKSCLDQP